MQQVSQWAQRGTLSTRGCRVQCAATTAHTNPPVVESAAAEVHTSAKNPFFLYTVSFPESRFADCGLLLCGDPLPLSESLLLAHNLLVPRGVHWCEVVRLVHAGRG